MTTDLVLHALDNALKNRNNPTGVIVHSDRGSQYNSTIFKAVLKRSKLLGSMGQVHTCADNAAMESFNALLQKNVFNQQKIWRTRSELIGRINKWVNVRYNKERRQAKLNDMTPREYDIIMQEDENYFNKNSE
jgi:transposase InsO family protein